MNFLVNWKTTIGGVINIGIGVTSLIGLAVPGLPAVSPEVAVGMIAGGISLLFAKDHNVTGGTVPAPPPAVVPPTLR